MNDAHPVVPGRGIITDDLRQERADALEAGREQEEQRKRKEIADFCEPDNLEVLVDKFATKARDTYVRFGKVDDVTIDGDKVTEAVAASGRCSSALLKAIQEVEPLTEEVEFAPAFIEGYDNTPKYPFMIEVYLASTLT